MELPAELRALRDFYYKTAMPLPAETDYVHAPGLLQHPGFFSLAHLKRHLNNPLLLPHYFRLYWQGKKVDLAGAVGHKVIQSAEVPFLNKVALQEYLSRGAALVLEGIDLLEPTINSMCAAIDAPQECVFSNAVAFMSQKSGEAYQGHIDTDDVLVIHLEGTKKWRIHERQGPRREDLYDLKPEQMGKVQAEIVMNPGDALYLRSGVPHKVQTLSDISLHMSFDICDRHVNAETALHLLLKVYDRAATRPYTPTMGVVEKLKSHAGCEAFERSVQQLQETQKLNYKQARAVFGRRVTFLDRFIKE